MGVFLIDVISCLCKNNDKSFRSHGMNAKYQGTISLNLLGGKLAPKLVYLVLRKELLNFSEIKWHPSSLCCLSEYWPVIKFYGVAAQIISPFSGNCVDLVFTWQQCFSDVPISFYMYYFVQLVLGRSPSKHWLTKYCHAEYILFSSKLTTWCIFCFSRAQMTFSSFSQMSLLLLSPGSSSFLSKLAQ